MLGVLVSIIILVFAGASNAGKRPQRVHFAYRRFKPNGDHAVEVWDRRFSTLIYRTCSTVVDKGEFANFRTVFHVDHNGKGKIWVQGWNYTIHDNLKISGGIDCTRMTNQIETVSACLVLIRHTSPEKRAENPREPFYHCFTSKEYRGQLWDVFTMVKQPSGHSDEILSRRLEEPPTSRPGPAGDPRAGSEDPVSAASQAPSD